MNTLSWLIYAAEVVGNLQGLLGFGAFLSAVILGLVAAFQHVENEYWIGARWFLIPVFCAVMATLIPSSKAMYMIAASEVGETIVTSPDATEMMGDLKAIIKKRLKDELSAE